MDCETNPVSGQLFETSIADLDTLDPGTLNPGTFDFRAGATASASRGGACGAAGRWRHRLRRLLALRAFGTTQGVLHAAQKPALRAGS